VSGKGKGSEWERDFCKYLSRWVQGTEKPYLFWRQPASGGLATIDKRNAQMSGDIHSIDPKGEFFTNIFSVELKNGYPSANFHQLLKGVKNFEIRNFWEQCTEAAFIADRQPMLIWKKTGMPPIVGIKNDLICRLDLTYEEKITLSMDAMPDVNFFNMATFFEKVTPDVVRGLNG